MLDAPKFPKSGLITSLSTFQVRRHYFLLLRIFHKLCQENKTPLTMTKNDNPFCETVLTQLTSLLALMQIWLHGNFQMSSPNVMTVSTFD